MNATIQKTMENLSKNGITARYAENDAEAMAILKEYLQPGDTVAVGGSVTLDELGVLPLLRSGAYQFLDRYQPGLSADEVREVFLKSFSADVYLCSSNAVTEDGALYNVDGNANRVSAISFGPKSVVMIVGVNKIVPTLKDAILRAKTVAAPRNAKRLSLSTYCAETGRCMSVDQHCGEEMAKGCRADNRICCQYLVSAKQRVNGRIKVIIVNRELGY